ncbi:MAG: hypothetical protein WCJ64_19135 [Rhodospirillaceae bacterium]
MAEPERPSDGSEETVFCRSCPVHPDPSARLAAVRRLPEHLLPIAMTDVATEIRRDVARRIGAEWLAVMAWDGDPGVRLIVATRLAPEQLVAMARDSDPRVRAEVATRVVPSALVKLAEDAAEEVCRVARLRLTGLIHPGPEGEHRLM